MKLNLSDESFDLIREKCRENHLRVTPQRLIIYRELLKSKDHPNAEALHKIMKKIIPDISLDTVNRTLLTFLKIGIIKNVEGYGEPRRYDPNIKNHHHFRCLNCKTIVDFDYAPYDAIIIPRNIKSRYSVVWLKD